MAVPHACGGILVDGAPLAQVTSGACSATHCEFIAKTALGDPVKIAVNLVEDDCSVTVTPAKPASIILRTAGIAPVYGFSDMVDEEKHYDTDLTGIVNYHLITGKGFGRMASDFAIFPRQGMAEVLLWPKVKIVHFTAAENALGAADVDESMTMHYFFGSTHTVYAAFAHARRQAGYSIFLPKYKMFGVGWEAFGALGWRTNQQTVRENIDRYLSSGYPLQWIVIGSGHWPAEPASMHETTSFGLWDKVRYPTPKPFLQHFHDEHLDILLGLRITFITTGPFAEEGVRNHYFIEENGKAKVFKAGWPLLPCYLLNAQSSAAVDWYIGLVEKWTTYGVDGFKEDFYSYGDYDLRDDKLNPISNRMMAQGLYLIERNGYLASDGDIQRINDFNYDQDQDRGPVNAMEFAYSGLPLVYPDIIGGCFAEDRFNIHETERMDIYMMRNAQWAALHPSLSVGKPSWEFKNTDVGKVMLKATQLHERLHAYIYSQAVRFFHDGYPWTMTPLPIAFPEEPGAYGRENNRTRGYEWMIGDALLATPLYGNDYDSATARDIYLPRGAWIDYETGERFQGPTLTKNHTIPAEKTPMFAGGTGIVVELENKAPAVRVYPIDKTAHTEFWSSDGKTRSEIRLHASDWNKLKVTDVTVHRTVTWTMVRFAVQFPLLPGHSYSVE